MQKPDSRLPLLDYCRFAAAVSVLSFHYFWNGIANRKITSMDHVDALTSWASYGYLGVDLFFMISGYVIFLSARRRTTSQFVVGRATRIYPAYLVAMLVTAAFACWLGVGETSVTLKQVVGNVLFYQPLHRQRFVDGVYWTLMYEVRFYFAVAVLIAVGAQKHFDRVFKLWPALMLLAVLAGPGAWMDPERGNWPLLGGYYAFFASGALFAIVRSAPSVTGCLALATSTALGLRYALALTGAQADTTQFAATALLLLSFTAVFFAINWSADRRELVLPLAATLGALTYPLYLVHAHIGYMLLSRFGSNEYRVPAYGLTIAFVFAVAWAIHELVEVRFARAWKSLFEAGAGLVERRWSRLRTYVWREAPR